MVTTFRTGVQTCCNCLFSRGVGPPAAFSLNKSFILIFNLPRYHLFDLRNLIQQPVFQLHQRFDIHDILFPLIVHISGNQICPDVQEFIPCYRFFDRIDQIIGIDVVDALQRRFEARQIRRLNFQPQEPPNFIPDLAPVQLFRAARRKKRGHPLRFDPADRQQLITGELHQPAEDYRLAPQRPQHPADLRPVVDFALFQAGHFLRPAQPARTVTRKIFGQRIGQQQRAHRQRDPLKVHDPPEQVFPLFLARLLALDYIVVGHLKSSNSDFVTV